MACDTKPDWDYYLDQPMAKTLAERASSDAPMADMYKAAAEQLYGTKEGPYFTDGAYYLGPSDRPMAETFAERASSGAPMAGMYKADEEVNAKLDCGYWPGPFGFTCFGGQPPGQQAAKIDWEKLAQSYAAALAEANSQIRELEAQVTKLTPPEPEPEPSIGDVLAKVLGHDNWPGVYGR